MPSARCARRTLSARRRDLGRVRARVLLPKAGILPHGIDADATLVIGDAALRSAFDTRPDRSTSAGSGSSAPAAMVFAVWAAPGARDRRACSTSTALRPPPVRLARSEPERLGAGEPRRTATRRLPYGALLKKLRYRLQRVHASETGLYTFEMARDAGELHTRPGAPVRSGGGAGVARRWPSRSSRSPRRRSARLRRGRPVALPALSTTSIQRSGGWRQSAEPTERPLPVLPSSTPPGALGLHANVSVTELPSSPCLPPAGRPARPACSPKPVIFQEESRRRSPSATQPHAGGRPPDLRNQRYYEDLFRCRSRHAPHPPPRPLAAGNAARVPTLEAHDSETLSRSQRGLDSVPAAVPRSSSTGVRAIGVAPKKRNATSRGDAAGAAPGHVDDTERSITGASRRSGADSRPHCGEIRDLQDETRRSARWSR